MSKDKDKGSTTPATATTPATVTPKPDSSGLKFLKDHTHSRVDYTENDVIPDDMSSETVKRLKSAKIIG